jgi:hypothetical protein
MIQVGEHRWRCSNNQSMETSKKQQPKTKVVGKPTFNKRVVGSMFNYSKIN